MRHQIRVAAISMTARASSSEMSPWVPRT